jgi:hypothetical protein
MVISKIDDILWQNSKLSQVNPIFFFIFLLMEIWSRGNYKLFLGYTLKLNNF